MKKKNSTLLLLPVAGTLLFVILYVVATLLYPGGSQADEHAVGFSWINNYWCNLLNEYAINRQYNAARPVAIAGMFVLCITIVLFWFITSLRMNIGKGLQCTIQISGTLSMCIACLLFTRFNHDWVVNLACTFGLIAITGIFIGLYKVKWAGLLSFGLINMLLVMLNNYVYYTRGMIVYLPVIQKISFAAFLIWMCAITVHIYRAAKSDK